LPLLHPTHTERARIETIIAFNSWFAFLSWFMSTALSHFALLVQIVQPLWFDKLTILSKIEGFKPFKPSPNSP
jgi:hypothetical protein